MMCSTLKVLKQCCRFQMANSKKLEIVKVETGLGQIRENVGGDRTVSYLLSKLNKMDRPLSFFWYNCSANSASSLHSFFSNPLPNHSFSCFLYKILPVLFLVHNIIPTAIPRTCSMEEKWCFLWMEKTT